MRATTLPPHDALLDPLPFELPAALAALEPPETRGLGGARDDVRLMVSHVVGDAITHVRFRDFPEFLTSGDVLVVNTSATINAALDAWRGGGKERRGERVAIHLSSPLPRGDWRSAIASWRTADSQQPAASSRWVIELRRLTADGTAPLLDARAGERLILSGGATAMLVEPFLVPPEDVAAGGQVRLWVAELACPGGVLAFAAQHGSPIRYKYVRERWPLAYYQTFFATEPGSAEMPSAGRAFTREIVEQLDKNGVRIARVVLHTGVASLERGERPYPERYRVPRETAELVNQARAAGHRVVAVGTTVVRALETVASEDGGVRPAEGWTDLVVTPERGVRVVDAILTGLHEPRSSHLAMLEALAGRRHLAVAYEAALSHRYLWHEFGDLHLILRGPAL
jgi:S-adenosylmethionine:tRNA ribosyltransferase-isomerase